jgi:hypothetical protein
MLTINFQKEGSILIPIYEVPLTTFLLDDSAIFNASKTYLTFKN